MKRKNRSKSYFNVFLKQFMLTLCVPCVIILFLYTQVEQVVKNQVLLANQGILHQFFRQMDIVMEDMKASLVSIANDVSCRNYALYAAYQEERAPFQSYVVRQTLNKLPLEKYYDAFVYFPESDQIISGFNGSVKSDYYYESHYQMLQDDESLYEGFRQIINSNSKRAELHTMKTGDGRTLLCMTMKRFNHRDSRLDYVGVLILDPAYLSRFLEGISSEQNGNILMYNAGRELLAGGAASETEYHLEGYNGQKTVYEETFGEEKYIVQVQESKIVSAYYTFVTPENYFWGQLSRLRLICCLGGGLFVLTAIGIAYMSAKKAYYPIGEVVSRLQEQGKKTYDKMENSELEFVEKILEQQSKEKNTLYHKVKSGEKARMEKILQFLLYGDAENINADGNFLEENGLELLSNRFLVSLLSFGKENVLEINLMSFVLKNVFMELCAAQSNATQSNAAQSSAVQSGEAQKSGVQCKSYVIALAADRYAILFNLDEMTGEAEVTAILEKGKKFLEEAFSLRISIGISRIQQGIQGISVAYTEAEAAEQYKFLLGNGEVIPYSRIGVREFKYSGEVESKLSRMIMAYVNDDDEQDLTELFVEKILNQYAIDRNASMMNVECFKFEIMSAVNKALISEDCFDEQTRELLKKLLQSPTLPEFKCSFCELLEILKQQVTQGGICKKAYCFIQENFRDPELSVALLGEKLRISPSYLSRLFKEKYGISILDSILQTRVGSAKEELRNTVKSVQQIAEENGFLSATVFIKAFKKTEGITPGAYRKKL